MMTLKQAIRHAKSMRAAHGEPWLVFITPANAPCNQGIAAIHNKGRFLACRASERGDYEAGGASFPTLPASSGIPEQVRTELAAPVPA